MSLAHQVNISGESFIKDGLTEINNGNLSIKVNCIITVDRIQANKNYIHSFVKFKTDNEEFTRQYQSPADLSGPNFIKQVYLYLKTLPEFSGATDC
jgi:hypothetical protein